jgi:class 3 adenylate cyclase/tetratricopeptide (TPR) repeat protein
VEPSPRIFVFGDLELDEPRFELRRGGRRVELEPTPFRLLQHLVRERDRVVPKEELLEAVWPDVVVSDAALSSALKAVRQALGDDGKVQRWVQTLRRRGVRFLGEVAVREPRPAAGPSTPAPPARRAEASVTTILFADLVASTAWLQALGDEGASRLFEALHARMTKLVESHAGDELQWLGDGLMAAFGSAADAVRAAIALQRAARQGVDGERPGLRVGLNVGEVLRQGRGTGSGYFGLPVIVASRLCDRAEAGEILASGVVAGLLAGRRAFRFRDLGPVELKGVEAPVPACAVLYEADPGTVALAGGTPFVGRAHEMACLEAALVRAEAGEGAVVFVTGEPGIGKTRLVREFGDTAREGGARVLAGGCFEGEGARPYAPFGEALDAYAAEAERAELLSDLGAYGSDIGAIAPRFARLPELPELPRLGAEEERTRLFYAVAELLLATAKRAPLVLLLDDLHWADGATIALLRYLGRLARQGRILVVGCYREGEVTREHPLALALAAMKREVEYERIALAGLEAQSVGEFLAALVEHAVGAPFVERMAAETGGNPFFLRELLVHLVESGKLRREEGTWTACLPLSEVEIPEGVRQVVGRRLARVSPAASRLLAAAAAFQGAFSFEVARRAVDQGESEGLDALDEALEAQLVRPAGGGAGDRYEFAHDLIRHALEALPSPSRRARLHRRLAEEMERAFGESAGERSAEIARQYHASRELPGAERGAAHALAAAELAERAAAQEEVARCLRIALDLIPREDARRPRLLARLALALAWSLAAEETARIASEAAEQIAETEGADAAADYLVELSRPVAVSSRPLAWRLAEQGLRHLGARRDLVWARLAWENERRKEHEDPDHLGLSLDTALRREITRVVLASGASPATVHRLGLDQELALVSREQALALGYTWAVAHLGGDLRRAATLLLESLSLALTRGELSAACQDLVQISILRSALGDLDAAEGCAAWATRLVTSARETSVLYSNLVSARAGLTWTRGEGFEGLILAGEAILERTAPDQAFARTGLLSSLAEGYALIGKAAQAEAAARRVLPAIERAPGWSKGYAGVLGNVVSACWWVALPMAGEPLERNLREKVLAPDFRSVNTDARLSLARLCALQGRFDEAVEWFAKAREVLDEQGARPLRAITDYDEALMYARRGATGDRARAAPLLDRAVAQFRAIGMPGWERRALALPQRA